MIPTEVTSSLVILTTCAFIIRGLLSYMAQSAKNTNSEYMLLRKQYEKKDADLIEMRSDRDLYKLKAMKYSDERNSAIKYAKHWREQAKKMELKQSETNVPPPHGTLAINTASTVRSDVSGVMKFELSKLESEIEASAD